MFCHRCGKSLPLESKFCNGCGIGIISNQPLKDEDIIFRIRPSFYSVGTIYLGAAIFSVAAIAVFGYFGLSIGTSLALSLVSFAFPLLRHFQRNRIVYTLTPSKIEIDFGIISKTVRNIPLRNTQDVTVSAGIFERIIGVGDVIIDSAAEAGKIQMRQVPDPRKYANLILQQLQQAHRLQ